MVQGSATLFRKKGLEHCSGAMTKRYPLEKMAEILACFRIPEEADRRMRMLEASWAYGGVSREELEKLVQESEPVARWKTETHLPQSFNQIRERTRLSGDEVSQYLSILVSKGILTYDKEEDAFDITEEGDRRASELFPFLRSYWGELLRDLSKHSPRRKRPQISRTPGGVSI
jgi:hypothetical protein